MKILAVISSARKEGTGAKIAKAVCDEAVRNGSEVEYVYLYDLDFKSCGNCQMSDSDPGFCTKKDDLVPVMKKLVEADALVWAAPIYMDYICGTSKTFLDRFCIFVEPDFTVNRTPGKKAVVIITSGAPADNYKAVTESVCGTLSGFFKMEIAGKISCGGQMNYGQEIPAEMMAQAKEAGKKLV
ncbi:MAG TPA: flavodoxin family protein [Clostridiales bacterium]|mgnify:CR=1 FL=1|nr:flavodoxin family protein [Clostridiales bacterium]HQP68853.1 flavodoxin family protein [Clostridiales bacterium]